jgi:hypothetical protein
MARHLTNPRKETFIIHKETAKSVKRRPAVKKGIKKQDDHGNDVESSRQAFSPLTRNINPWCLLVISFSDAVVYKKAVMI